jgi:hypothetical protein
MLEGDEVLRGHLTCSQTLTQGAGVVDFTGIEPKQMSTGLARMSSMLSGKMTSLVEAIELHKEP